MKKRLLIYVSLLTLGAGPAWAAGINLGWLDCPSGATYTLARTFACDVNTGTNILVASYVAPANVLAASANELVVDVQTGGPALSEWWKLRTGACRPTSLTSSSDFTFFATCTDYWGGFASNGHSQDVLVPGNRMRIKGLAALPSGHAQIGPVAENTEVYSFRWAINNLKSTGLGACAGCSDEACIVLNSIKINQPTGPPADGVSILISNPAVSQYAIWQAWTTADPSNACPLVTPAKQKTWGSIKALYR